MVINGKLRLVIQLIMNKIYIFIINRKQRLLWFAIR